MIPTIGVTRCQMLDDYLEAVRTAGARPQVLDGKDPRLEGIDGLLLTGGGDLEASHYGERPHPKEVNLDPPRDRFELEVTRHALDADRPMLGICRGLQVLNVVSGGTLLQDIPAQTSSAQPHQVDEPRDALAHWIRVSPGSRLADIPDPRLTPDSTCRVNSRHHQAPGRIGHGLRVVATSPDGVIEALEHDDARFCVGVQWHPENFWRSGEFRELFSALVRAAHGP